MIEVQSPGLFTTIQDLGRPGFGPLGVSASGAADAISLRLANKLVGNPENAAALEMTLLGPTLLFHADATIALAGSNFGAPVYGPRTLQAGEALHLGPTQSGARCYLAVRGGLAVPLFLGSASTHVLSGLGGFEGRPLRKGDLLPIGDTSTCTQPRPPIDTSRLNKLTPRKQLRLTRGPEWNLFPSATKLQFLQSEYRVSEESNRMGLRLEGPPIHLPGPQEMVSEGVALGAIQIPANGQPIILFVEQQTTGGYPKIANIIAADLHSVGQLRPRDPVRFHLVELDAARALIREQEALLRSEALWP